MLAGCIQLCSLSLQTGFEDELPPPPLPPKDEEIGEANEEEIPPQRPPKPASMSPPPVGDERSDKAISPEPVSEDSELCPLPEPR